MLPRRVFTGKDTGIIYFLPTRYRPHNLPPLPPRMRRSMFWHVGITYSGKCYECFNYGKYRITLTRIRYKEFPNGKAVFIDNNDIDINKLRSEIISGTDCAEYVARVIGLSDKTGLDKGKYYPDDLYNILFIH